MRQRLQRPRGQHVAIQHHDAVEGRLQLEERQLQPAHGQLGAARILVGHLKTPACPGFNPPLKEWLAQFG